MYRSVEDRVVLVTVVFVFVYVGMLQVLSPRPCHPACYPATSNDVKKGRFTQPPPPQKIK
jgi:hypothetical protein